MKKMKRLLSVSSMIAAATRCYRIGLTMVAIVTAKSRKLSTTLSHRLSMLSLCGPSVITASADASASGPESSIEPEPEATYFVVGRREYPKGGWKGVVINTLRKLDAHCVVIFPRTAGNSIDFPVALDDKYFWCQELTEAEFGTYQAFGLFPLQGWMQFTGSCWWHTLIRREKDTWQVEPGVASTRDYYFLDEKFDRPQRGRQHWFGCQKKRLDWEYEEEYLELEAA